MAWGVTDAGFVRPRLADIKDEIEQEMLARFGATIDLTAGSLFSQIIGVYAEREDLVWQGMEDAYNSQYPDTAFGVSLDNVGALSGVPRLGALASKVNSQRLFGTAGTLVPAGTQLSVSGSPASVFATDAAVTLVAGVDEVQKITFSAVPTSGQWKLKFGNVETSLLAFNANAAAVQAAIQLLQYAGGCLVTGDYTSGFTFTFAGVSGKQDQETLIVSSNTLVSGGPAVSTAVTVLTQGQNQGTVNVTATSVGPTVANAGTLTTIVTPVAGLTATVNRTDAVVGRLVETDNDYRARRAQLLQSSGAATLEAIRAALFTVAGVTAVIVFENDSSIPDLDGRPGHSFEAVVQGGLDQDIWDKIWEVKAAGIFAYGSQIGTVVDSQGQSQTVAFSRPTSVPIYIDLTLTIDPVTFPANGVAAAQQALVTSGNALGIGADVVVSPYLICSLGEIPGILGVVLKIGTAPAPTLSNNIPIAPNEVSSFDTSRISVTTI